MPASRITAMKITKTVTGNWWQSREIRPYLIESISHFNEARVYSRENDETGRCEFIANIYCKSSRTFHPQNGS